MEPLMDLTGHVHPAKFMDRRIDARVRRFVCDLGVISRLLETKIVVEIVGRLPFRLTSDGEARQILGGRLVGEIEGEKRLGVSAIRSQRKISFLLSDVRHAFLRCLLACLACLLTTTIVCSGFTMHLAATSPRDPRACRRYGGQRARCRLWRRVAA